MLQEGYYTALGTPLDSDGRLIPESFAQHVDDQINFQASGLLVMGSMGMGVFVRNEDYVLVAKTAVDTAKGRCPVFIGATDTSIGRVCDRIAALEGLPIDGVVMTAPYYFPVGEAELIRFFSEIARCSPFPIYLYDLPVAARNKITRETMLGLKDCAGIKGIKTADADLAHYLQGQVKEGTFARDFVVLYSGLDTFDSIYEAGVKRNLDGMFACTGQLSQTMYTALAKGDYTLGTSQLKAILALRNIFAEEIILPSFTYAMNLLGYAGKFHQDFYPSASIAQQEKISAYMKQVGLV